jgi:hypothetical protein
MQSEDFSDLPFCDLCNASVPLQDLESGAAVKVDGRTIGVCCRSRLPVEDAVASAAGASDSAVPGGDQPVRWAPEAGPAPHGESRILPAALVLLIAIAAAAIFLDHRVTQLEEQLDSSQIELLERLQQQDKLLQALQGEFDGVARTSRIAGIEGMLQSGTTERGVLAEQVRLLAQQVAAAEAAMGERLARSDAARPDYGPALDDLRQQLQRQSISVAQLLASPQSTVRQPEVEPAPVVPESAQGLAENLQHEVARLGDDDPATRFQAADELLRSRDAKVVEYLLPMTRDQDLFVRRLVVEGLAAYRLAEVVDALLVSLADPEDIVRDTAWRSLKAITGQEIPFEAAGSAQARTRAQQRWQEWWERNRTSFGS